MTVKAAYLEPRYTFGLKTSTEWGDKPPGPGTYDPSLMYTKEKHATAKIGTSQRGTGGSASGTPGPGQYVDEFKSALRKTGTTFGKQTRGRTTDNTKAPGPGTYELSYDYKNNPHAKTFGVKFHSSLNTSQLGPGSYDPNIKTVRRNADSKSFGVSRTEGGNRNVNPGPGTYEHLMNKTTPAWR